MRIRRSLQTLVSPSDDSSNEAALTSSDPADSLATPRRCSTTNSSSLVCVLNQSPWDVADPSSQLEGGLFSLTGTCIVSDLPDASQSLASSVKLSGDKRKQRDGAPAAASDKHIRENIARLNPSQGKIRAEKSNSSMVLSSKPQIRSSSVKKPQQRSTDLPPKRRGRPAKKSAANPNEFYYYSGFGPHWGKKRDNINNRPPPPTVTKTTLTDELSSEAPSPLSMSVEARGRGVEFVDYDEDDDDEAEDGRSRGGRKRVKARSLKSLM